MNSDPPPAAPVRRAAVTFIFVTVMLDVLAMGIIIPILPPLVAQLAGGDSRHGVHVYGWFGTAWAAMQFIAAPVLGALSDRFGRRPVVLLSNFGLGADYVLMALAPNLFWLFVGRVISGVTAASIPTAMAYIADVTPPEKRAASFGMVGAAFGLGFVVGPVFGGQLGLVDPRLPFWVAAGLSLANACYGFFVLPESVPADRRQPFAWSRANPVGALSLLRAHPGLLGLASVSFLCYLAHEVYPNVFVLYVTQRFDWNLRAVGLTLGAVGVCVALTQTVLTRAAMAHLGERKTILVGLSFGVMGFLLYGLATTSFWFRMAIPLIAPWGIANAAIQGFMSRHVGVSEQGLLQGAVGSVRGITGLIGPSLFTMTFAAVVPGGALARSGWQLPGAPFVLSASLIFVSLLIAWLVTRREPDGRPAVDDPALPRGSSPKRRERMAVTRLREFRPGRQIPSCRCTRSPIPSAPESDLTYGNTRPPLRKQPGLGKKYPGAGPGVFRQALPATISGVSLDRLL